MLEDIALLVRDFGSAPTLAEMTRLSLADKKIAGPTSAHVIEEIHTPLNFAYTTFTTGSSSFQNIVGVTHAELSHRIAASRAVFDRVGLVAGDRLLVTYPPLVNVFSGDAIKAHGLECSFLTRSSRDAFLVALYEQTPRAVVGESSFLRAAFEDARRMGVMDELPRGLALLTAGTPLDLELLPVADLLQARVYDLYGCQEFGWLVLNGVPLRDDIVLLPFSGAEEERRELVVGGLAMGDTFPVSRSGHILDSAGKIITYRRERAYPEHETIVEATKLASNATIQRVARTILRIKGRIVRVSPNVKIRADHTVLRLAPDSSMGTGGVKNICDGAIVEGPVKTRLFDDLVQAQVDYQQNGKADPVWKKRSF